MIIYYILLKIHCIKIVQIRSFFWSVFSHIRTEYGDASVSLRIQSECGKMQTRKNSVFGHFLRSDIFEGVTTILNKNF